MSHVDGQVKKRVELNDDIKEPGMYHVVFLNDDSTPMDFVVQVLMEIFGKSENDAIKIMMKVHNEGDAIAGTYVEDIAITKSETTRRVALANGFPLTTKVQPA
jgi:ATP-dependent Clp protease adaptor protein ClpS